MLHVLGRLDEAARHYRRAVELRPDNVDAHSNLGRILMTTGQDAAAVDAFRRALSIRADHVSALSGLGWVLATSAVPGSHSPKEALAAAEPAAALTSRTDPSVLDSLAAALASTATSPVRSRPRRRPSRLRAASARRRSLNRFVIGWCSTARVSPTAAKQTLLQRRNRIRLIYEGRVLSDPADPVIRTIAAPGLILVVVS
jgi:tetratricopeptide (TPR) repeat protein